MNTDIRAIYLDLGGTFRIIEENKAYADAAKKKIAQLCGITAPDPVAYFDTVTDKRYDLYREWALRFMAEAPEEVLWSRWLAYDCPRELVERNAAELTYQYRQTKGIRTVVPGGAETVQELCRRGYTLGIISDLVGKHEVDEWLDHDGLRPLFQNRAAVLRLLHPQAQPRHLLLRPGRGGHSRRAELLCGRQSQPRHRGRQGLPLRHDRHRPLRSLQAPEADGGKQAGRQGV